MILHFHPEAEQELLDSANYYEDKKVGLGNKFLVEVQRVLDLIKSFPELGAPFTKAERKISLKHFPFSVIYTIYDKYIVIYAIMHQKRKPGYWKSRK